VAGKPAYLWARVTNDGDQAVTGARVNFYWSNPALGVLRSTANVVGFAFVDLAPTETKEVLCLARWTPIVVNAGHECLVAEVIHPSDPLPTPPPDDFDPPAYRQIAQRNVSVLTASPGMLLVPLQVATPPRLARDLHVAIEIGGALAPAMLAQHGLPTLRAIEPNTLRAALSLSGKCDESGDEALDVTIEPGQARPVYLKLWPGDLQRGTYALIHIVARTRTALAGGITFVVLEG